MRLRIVVLTILFAGISCYSQEVTVTATTNQRDVDKILKKTHKEGEFNRAFFSEDDRCRAFLKAREWATAENSCKLAISLAEKLPVGQLLERADARASLGIALIWQRRPKEAIRLLNRAIEIREAYSKEADADTADIFTLLGHAYVLTADIESARTCYEKAERMYREAFIHIGDDGDEIRFTYPRRLRNALLSHYELVKSAGLTDEAQLLRSRLEDVEREFAKYLQE